MRLMPSGFFVIALSLFIANFIQADPGSRQVSENLRGDQPVGALIPLSGAFGVSGQDVEAGIEFAVETFNQQLNQNAEWQIKLNLQDTATNPMQALSRLQALRQNGINLVIGPVTSASVATTKTLAQGNNETLLFSPASVATDHSTPGDGVFRLVPDANFQGAFFVDQLLGENIHTIVIAHRNDTWGWDFSRVITEVFQKKGGRVHETISYRTNNINPLNIAGNLAAAIQDVSEMQKSLDGVAIVILSFEEISDIFEQAARRPLGERLEDLRWFGAVSTYPQIISNKRARDFAEKAQYTAVILEINRSLPIYNKVRSAIQTMRNITREPDVHSYIAYDSVQILGEAIREAGSIDVEEVINQLPAVAEKYNGFVGNARLNKNGDLSSGNYQSWQVIDGRWQKLAESTAVTFASSTLTVILPIALVSMFY